jgi:pilus assembly protein CpaF
MEGDVLSMHDIFEFCQTGLDEHRRATGYFYATGIRPHCLSRIESTGIHVGVELFEERELYVQEPIRKGV